MYRGVTYLMSFLGFLGPILECLAHNPSCEACKLGTILRGCPPSAAVSGKLPCSASQQPAAVGHSPGHLHPPWAVHGGTPAHAHGSLHGQNQLESPPTVSRAWWLTSSGPGSHAQRLTLLQTTRTPLKVPYTVQYTVPYRVKTTV